ncbi:MAG: hypothetical protein KJN76_02340, partial [Eudoraea sp.]|nr:hypothetical protein [Eudoraea sp.]
NGYDEYSPPVYRDVSAYYIQVGSATPVQIALNKRQVLKYLRNGGYADIKQYASENNLKLKTEKEVLQLLNYYNSLKKAVKTPQINS